MIVDVLHLILGAYFPNYFSLLANVHQQRLLNSSTELSVLDPSALLLKVRYFFSAVPGDIYSLLDSFPVTIDLIFKVSDPVYSMRYFVNTSLPVFSRLCYLLPHKLKAEKVEFVLMFQ